MPEPCVDTRSVSAAAATRAHAQHNNSGCAEHGRGKHAHAHPAARTPSRTRVRTHTDLATGVGGQPSPADSRHRVARCDGTLASIKINPEALNPGDAQLVEEMILTATNQALAKAKEISSSEMAKLTAGLNIPGLT